MLKSLLLSSTFAPFRAPDDETGSDNAQVDDVAAAAAGAQGEPAADDAGDDAAAGEQQPAAAAVAADAPSWKDKEIRRKHAQLQESKRREAELQQQLADAQALIERQQASGKADEGPAGDDGRQQPAARPAARAAPVMAEEAIRREANRLHQTSEYNRACNAANDAGQKAYGDKWTNSVDRLAVLGGFDISDMQRILATDDAAKVLYELGNDPERYHKIVDLPPERRHTEFVKISMAKAKAKPASNAPAPVETVAGRGRAAASTIDLYDPNATDEDWFKVRLEQKRKKYEASKA